MNVLQQVQLVDSAPFIDQMMLDAGTVLFDPLISVIPTFGY